MSDSKRFAWQEALIGFVAVTASVSFLGWNGLWLALGCGGLWMLGGTYLKTIRREGVNLCVFGYACWFNGFEWWYLLGLVLGITILHQGDGFPDYRPTTKDEGSPLGRFVEKYINANDQIGGPITKWLIALAFQLSLIPYMFHK